MLAIPRLFVIPLFGFLKYVLKYLYFTTTPRKYLCTWLMLLCLHWSRLCNFSMSSASFQFLLYCRDAAFSSLHECMHACVYITCDRACSRNRVTRFGQIFAKCWVNIFFEQFLEIFKGSPKNWPRFSTRVARLYFLPKLNLCLFWRALEW
jgi:hypothetical protein